jgi:hypothetical protein
MSTRATGNTNVVKLMQYVEINIESRVLPILMNGKLYIKGFCEVLLGQKLKRAQTCVNTRYEVT